MELSTSHCHCCRTLEQFQRVTIIVHRRYWQLKTYIHFTAHIYQLFVLGTPITTNSIKKEPWKKADQYESKYWKEHFKKYSPSCYAVKVENNLKFKDRLYGSMKWQQNKWENKIKKVDVVVPDKMLESPLDVGVDIRCLRDRLSENNLTTVTAFRIIAFEHH